MDALALDAAGELVMRDLALDAQRRLRSIQGAGSTVHVFKNNVDSAGIPSAAMRITWCDGSCR